MFDEDPPEKIYADLTPDKLPLTSKSRPRNQIVDKVKKILTLIWLWIESFCLWYSIIYWTTRFLWWLTSDEEIAGDSNLLENHFVPDPMPNFTLPLHIYLTREWNVSATADPENRLDHIIRYSINEIKFSLNFVKKSLNQIIN